MKFSEGAKYIGVEKMVSLAAVVASRIVVRLSEAVVFIGQAHRVSLNARAVISEM